MGAQEREKIAGVNISIITKDWAKETDLKKLSPVRACMSACVRACVSESSVRVSEKVL